MKKICLYCFSGTGMTRYVADKLVGEFEKHQVAADCFRIEDAESRSVALSGYDAFGIAYPVHAFNAPKIVMDFIKRLPKADGMDTFIIHTCGEDHTINYASSDLLIKRLRKKGYGVFHNKLIEMPCNFVVRHTDERVREILDNANKAIPQTARDVIEQRPFRMRKSLGAKIAAFFGRAEWYGVFIMGKFFAVRKSCVRCGKCADGCPNRNIVMKEKSIGFKWRCGLCMRCLYNCPVNALRVRHPFRFIHVGKWYDPDLFK